jgi:hypothetical protein
MRCLGKPEETKGAAGLLASDIVTDVTAAMIP